MIGRRKFLLGATALAATPVLPALPDVPFAEVIEPVGFEMFPAAAMPVHPLLAQAVRDFYRNMHDELLYGRAWNADGPNLFTATHR